MDEDEIRLLWDKILDILLDRVNHKSISVKELTHLVDELDILFRAVKGKTGVWCSVVDVALLLLRADATIHDLRTQLPYNESTIYRALNRLETAGIVVPVAGEAQARVWMLNKNLCPVLYRASRPA